MKKDHRNFHKFSDRSGQTVQTQMRLLLESLHCLLFVCTVWTHYSMVEPHSSNFRVITTIFFGVRILGNLQYLQGIIHGSKYALQQIYQNYYSNTPRLQVYSVVKILFYSATIHWAEMCAAIWRHFMTSSFPSTMSP